MGPILPKTKGCECTGKRKKRFRHVLRALRGQWLIKFDKICLGLISKRKKNNWQISQKWSCSPWSKESRSSVRIKKYWVLSMFLAQTRWKRHVRTPFYPSKWHETPSRQLCVLPYSKGKLLQHTLTRDTWNPMEVESLWWILHGFVCTKHTIGMWHNGRTAKAWWHGVQSVENDHTCCMSFD